jgi:hypothetical protein
MMKQRQLTQLGAYIGQGDTRGAVDYLAGLAGKDKQAESLYGNLKGLEPGKQVDFMRQYLSEIPKSQEIPKPTEKKTPYIILRRDSPDLSTTLVQRNFTYSAETGLVERKAGDVVGIKHFSEYYDSQGNRVKREDFDEKGGLKRVTVYNYRDGELVTTDFYEANLNATRQRNTDTGIIEERTPEGKLIGKLRDD